MGNINPIRGNCDFEFTVDPSEILADTEVVKPNLEIKDGDKVFIVEEYTSNKVGQKIYVKYGKNTLENHSVDLIGTDNLGNKVEFNERYRKDDEGMFEIYKLEGGLSPEATEITLQTYAVEYPEGGGKIPYNYEKFGKPFTIKIK